MRSLRHRSRIGERWRIVQQTREIVKKLRNIVDDRIPHDLMVEPIISVCDAVTQPDPFHQAIRLRIVSEVAEASEGALFSAPPTIFRYRSTAERR